jgi:hypothetical protein
MNCPKCGKSLWLVKTFCPFCKARIVKPPRLPETPLPLFHWIMLAAWSLWLVHRLVVLFLDGRWLEPQATADDYGRVIATAISMPIFVGIAGWLGWCLYRQPTRRVTVWFIVLCVTLVWKSWIIMILLKPALRPYSLLQPLAWWSSVGKVSFGNFVLWFLPPQILLLSLFVWPAYCWRTQSVPSAIRKGIQHRT